MREVHAVNTWLVIGLNAVAGAWCLLAFRLGRWGGRPVWATVIAAQLSVFVQAAVGAVLANQDGVELDDMHALYGFSAIVAVAIMYSYRTSPFMKGKALVLYGFGSLFVMGLGLRNLVLI
ncbi:MAG TPA: hypothetical protein VIS05_06160 [Ilumatobacter sp.]